MNQPPFGFSGSESVAEAIMLFLGVKRALVANAGFWEWLLRGGGDVLIYRFKQEHFRHG